MQRRQVIQLGMLATGALLPGVSQAVLKKSVNAFDPLLPTVGSIRLNANENVYGPSDEARKAIMEALSMANRYPLVDAIPTLRKEIAAYHNLSESMVFITPGSLHALKVIGSRLGGNQGNHVAPDLSYAVLMRQSELSGCEWKKVPVKKDKAIDLSGMRSAIDRETRFVYVTNPNNPTGHYIPHATLRAFCEEVSADLPLVVDEAYLEFVTGDEKPSMVPLLSSNPNLVVTRTFSKMYGLAGLRVGYALAKEEWVNDWKEWDQAAGIGVSNVAARAASACLKDQTFLRTSREKIIKTRSWFIDQLDLLGIQSYPSNTNFILAEIGDRKEKLKSALNQNKIELVLGRSGPMRGLSRISMGTEEEMQLLIKTIKSIS